MFSEIFNVNHLKQLSSASYICLHIIYMPRWQMIHDHHIFCRWVEHRGSSRIDPPILYRIDDVKYFNKTTISWRPPMGRMISLQVSLKTISWIRWKAYRICDRHLMMPWDKMLKKILPIVVMWESINSSLAYRHKTQVFPTPVSPINNKRIKTS